jgi:hypothetical protein
MNLREEILREHSRVQMGRIVEWIGSNQERFDALIDLFLHDEYRVVQRAAWPLSNCAVKYPQLIKKHLGRILKNLHKPNLHNAVKRNTVRLLQAVDVPLKYQGEVMDLCFGYIISPDEPAAVKAFSLGVLQQLAKSYPDILPEIKLVINQRWPYESAAFRSRARKILGQKGDIE